jgi:hypothetical protein
MRTTVCSSSATLDVDPFCEPESDRAAAVHAPHMLASCMSQPATIVGTLMCPQTRQHRLLDIQWTWRPYAKTAVVALMLK